MQMKKLSHYLLGFLFLVLVVELILVSPSELKETDGSTVNRQNPQFNPPTEDVEQIMQGLHLIESQNEYKEWELWADSAVGFKTKSDWALKKVRANFFARNGVSFEVVGETGAVLTEAKNMKVDGGVVTKSSNGYVFKTTALSYDSKNRSLTSPTPVEVMGPRDQTGKTLLISGQEMAADLDKGIVLIEKDVKAKKTVRVDKRMAVIAEKVQLSGKDRALRFMGNVIIDIEGVRISGPDALFRYDKENQQIESIDLEGGVKVSDLNKWATSDKLSINLTKNEFVFDGKPRVVQDNDELRGDQIIFLDGGKKVKVHNAKVKVSEESLGSIKK